MANGLTSGTLNQGVFTAALTRVRQPALQPRQLRPGQVGGDCPRRFAEQLPAHSAVIARAVSGDCRAAQAENRNRGALGDHGITVAGVHPADDHASNTRDAEVVIMGSVAARCTASP